MPDGLYEHDILLWSEEQGRLLQRVAAGEAGVNAAVDWAHVIEEVEAVGRSEFKACESLLVQAMLHLCKLHAWPDSQSAGPWAVEVRAFLRGAQRAFSLSMRPKLDVPELYAEAAYLLVGVVDGSGPPRPLPDACPFTLDTLLDKHPDVPALAARLGSA